MEKNTYATSTYIATSPEAALAYLGDLRNLTEWTLGCRMVRQIDDDTWLGLASGYQHELYYHVRRVETPLVRGVEWHCGPEYQKYSHCYPALLFEPPYVEAGSDEGGVYFHWVSFIDPARRTPMIMQGIHTVHTAECRSLKAALERRAGRAAAARGRHRVATSSIFIDAPFERAAAYVGDVRNLGEWAYFLRPSGEVARAGGTFEDEYGHRVEARARLHDLRSYALIELDFEYPGLGFVQRSPLLLMPCSYAFGTPAARGCIAHRIAFFREDGPPTNGKLQIEDYGAESMSLKRILEKQAGNLDAFARGPSYEPAPAGREGA